MSFAIVIPSRNIENLTKCVAAIRAAGEDCRILCVDDGVAWPYVPNGLGVWTISGQDPFCFARNVNIGLHSLDDEWRGITGMFLWNDDALLIGRGDRPLTAMARAVEYSIEIDGNAWGVVSCAIQGHAGPAYPMSDHRLAELYAGVDPSLWPVRPSANPKMVPFTAVYIPRRALDIVGPLDERFTGVADGEEVYGGEDDDWCFRARSKGFRIGVYDGALVDHATLPSTFRPDGKGRSIAGAKARFREIHGFQMGTR